MEPPLSRWFLHVFAGFSRWKRWLSHFHDLSLKSKTFSITIHWAEACFTSAVSLGQGEGYEHCSTQKNTKWTQEKHKHTDTGVSNSKQPLEGILHFQTPPICCWLILCFSNFWLWSSKQWCLAWLQALWPNMEDVQNEFLLYRFDTMYQESAYVLPRYRQWETKPEFISGDSWLWLQWPSSWNGPWWCVLHVCSMTTIMSTWIHWHPFSSCDQMSQAIHSKRASNPEPLLEATSCHHWLSWWNFHLCRSNWWGCLKNRLPSTIIGLSSGSLAFPVWFPVWNVRLYYFMGYNGILIFFQTKPHSVLSLEPSHWQPATSPWNDHPICWHVVQGNIQTKTYGDGSKPITIFGGINIHKPT